MLAAALSAIVMLTVNSPAAVPETPPAADAGTAVVADSTKPATPSFSSFRPSTHGFAFVNSFRGSPLPVSLGNLQERLNIPNRFGLCGGMCFAAADYFLAGRNIREEVPATEPPANGTPLYQYLYARQAASLAPAALMFTRFLEWMDLPESGEDGTHTRTRNELPAILDAIEVGRPVMLGLVLVDGRETREVWRNHQILVYGYKTSTDDQKDDSSSARDDNSATTPTLRIYDPNFPDRDDAVIRWIPCKDDQRWERQVPGTRRAITRVRGFFQMAYTPVEPPSDF